MLTSREVLPQRAQRIRQDRDDRISVIEVLKNQTLGLIEIGNIGVSGNVDFFSQMNADEWVIHKPSTFQNYTSGKTGPANFCFFLCKFAHAQVLPILPVADFVRRFQDACAICVRKIAGD
jgi:hypothetical protein